MFKRLVSRFFQGLLSSSTSKKLALFFLKNVGYGVSGNLRDSGEYFFIKAIVRNYRAPVVFDVGSHVGEYAKRCLECNKNSIVHCFEPSSYHFEKLSANLSGCGGVFLNNFGLSVKDESLTLYKNSEVSGMASLYQRDLSHVDIKLDKEEVCEFKAPINYLAEKDITTINLLKIDVEGHEFAVLRAFEDLFRKQQIDHCQFEFGHTSIENRLFFKDYYEFFREHGYRLFILAPNGFLDEVVVYEEFLENHLMANYVASLI